MEKPPQPSASRSSGDEGHAHHDAGHHWSLATKMMAGGFVTIVAPVLVAFIVKVLDPPAAPAPASGNAAPTAGDPKPAPAANGATATAASDPLPADPAGTDDSPGSASRPKRAAAEYVSLFNGNDTSGWKVTENSRWSVDAENHALVGEDTGGNQHAEERWIFTDKDYADFRLRFEYRYDGPTKGGLSLRTVPGLDPTIGRMRVQIVSDDHVDGTDHPTGNIAGLGTEGKQHIAVALATGVQRSTGRWNSAIVEFRGPQLRIWINRQLVQDVRAENNPDHPRVKEGLRLPKGRIGLQVIFGRFEVRNIDIEELPRAAK